jgi:hypothetical protein
LPATPLAGEKSAGPNAAAFTVIAPMETTDPPARLNVNVKASPVCNSCVAFGFTLRMVSKTFELTPA